MDAQRGEAGETPPTAPAAAVPAAPAPMHVDAGDTSTPPPVRPTHVLPRDFRGPEPREDDAEDIAPQPYWVPAVPGTDSLGHTPNMPMNKNGWRYAAAGPAADRLPLSVFRTLDIAPRGVHWSWQDRSAFMRISRDAAVVGTDKGFRSARTNIGVRHGACYVEVRVLPPDASSAPAAPMRDGPHARVGWGRREASLNAPVGYDAYSYGMRDGNGASVTLSRPQPYGEAFGIGDVVGLYIRLPPADAPPPAGSEARVRRKHIPIRYKNQLYFESLEYAPSREMDRVMDQSRRGNAREPEEPRARRTFPPQRQKAPSRPLPRLADSCIGFVVNGRPQGIAFAELYDFRPLQSERTAREAASITAHSSAGAILKTRENPYDDGSLGYFPMVSLYGGARAQLISRDFVFPPAVDLEDQLWRASEARGHTHVRQHAAPPFRALGDVYDEWANHEWACDLDSERIAKECGACEE